MERLWVHRRHPDHPEFLGMVNVPDDLAYTLKAEGYAQDWQTDQRKLKPVDPSYPEDKSRTRRRSYKRRDIAPEEK